MIRGEKYVKQMRQSNKSIKPNFSLRVGTFFQPPEGRIKNSWNRCWFIYLKIVLTEFHVSNSIGFRKGIQIWSHLWLLWGRNFEKLLLTARLGFSWNILWNFHGNRSRGLGCALPVRVSEDFDFYIDFTIPCSSYLLAWHKTESRRFGSKISF